MNDWNFFVREVGRGRGVQERSLEVTVSRRGGRRWRRHEAGLDIFWKKDLESLSRLSFSELRLVTKMLTMFCAVFSPVGWALLTGVRNTGVVRLPGRYDNVALAVNHPAQLHHVRHQCARTLTITVLKTYLSTSVLSYVLWQNKYQKTWEKTAVTEAKKHSVLSAILVLAKSQFSNQQKNNRVSLTVMQWKPSTGTCKKDWTKSCKKVLQEDLKSAKINRQRVQHLT